MDLRGKASWQSGAKQQHKVTLHNKPHTRDLLGKTKEGGCLCSGKKQEVTEQKARFVGEGRVFQGGLGFGGSL